MGYCLKRLPYKKRNWKVQYQSWKGGRKTSDIAESEYRSLGFLPSMTLEEAKERVKQLNAVEALERQAEARIAIKERLDTETLVQDAYLPRQDVEEFERKCAFTGKGESHWRAAKRVLCDLRLPVDAWADDAAQFYRAFTKLRMSYSYVQKVLPILNRWGQFQARKYGLAFLPVPSPRGIHRGHIEEAYFGKNEDGMASLPLTPNALESKRSALLPDHYNWLAISVWFGLRPNEIDLLHAPPDGARSWRINGGNTPVLWVYQSKLVAVPPKERFKYIPCVYPEQKALLDVIRSGQFKRPLAKTVRAHFGPRVTCYAGRKGFTDLMLDKGQELEVISIWMGHRSIERTWRSYKNKTQVRFKPAA